jgi:recombination protein RecA
MAVSLEIVDKSGAWFAYNGQKIGQGRENAKQYLIENPIIMKEIEKKVRENFDKAFEKSMGEIVDVDSSDEQEIEALEEEISE